MIQDETWITRGLRILSLSLTAVGCFRGTSTGDAPDLTWPVPAVLFKWASKTRPDTFIRTACDPSLHGENPTKHVWFTFSIKTY